MSAPQHPRRRSARKPVGWREWVSFPTLDVDTIEAKIDTGARTSALHAHRLRVVVKRGVETARFEIHPVAGSARPSIKTEAEVVDWRRVRSSSGHLQHRPVILTDVVLGDQRWEIEVTLTSRDAMGYRLLLGRTAIAGRFVVDVARSHTQRVPGQSST